MKTSFLYVIFTIMTILQVKPFGLVSGNLYTSITVTYLTTKCTEHLLYRKLVTYCFIFLKFLKKLYK